MSRRFWVATATVAILFILFCALTIVMAPGMPTVTHGSPLLPQP
jgi:hypothetical protein